MQVTISVAGRFHAFYLAQQLLKRGYLNQLITSYPKFEVERYGIPKDRVSSVLIKEVLERGWQKIPFRIKNKWNPQYFILDTFDALASKSYRSSDICVAFSGAGLHTIRKAKKMGAVTILERGSSHMLYQRNILQEEYERLGLVFRETHPKIVEKELLEYEEADYISIPSRFVKQTFLEKGISAEKLLHVPYGVHLDEFTQKPKNDSVFRVIYAGAMSIRKGVHYLLQAFSELNLPGSELLLIGGKTDEMSHFFQKYRGSFRWVDHIPQRHLFKHYSQGSVFALMSIEEGLAMVQLQAMACGLPVICTTNTGGEDIIRDGIDGYIIPIRDIERLKEKLLYLYQNPEKIIEMGKRAKERVCNRFTWDDYGEKIINEYDKIYSNSQFHSRK